jgi:hypothetical protein
MHMKIEFITTFITLNQTALTSLLHKLPFSIHSCVGTKDKQFGFQNASLTLSCAPTIWGNLYTVPGSRPTSNTIISLNQHAGSTM